MLPALTCEMNGSLCEPLTTVLWPPKPFGAAETVLISILALSWALSLEEEPCPGPFYPLPSAKSSDLSSGNQERTLHGVLVSESLMVNRGGWHARGDLSAWLSPLPRTDPQGVTHAVRGQARPPARGELCEKVCVRLTRWLQVCSCPESRVGEVSNRNASETDLSSSVKCLPFGCRDKVSVL